MPTAKSIYWKLRVDTNEYEWCDEFVAKYADLYIYAMEMEGTENQHCHFYLQVRSDVKEAAMRQHIGRTIGRGNGKYSLGNLSEALPIEYCAYIVKPQKDKGRIFENVGPQYMQACKEYNEKVLTEIKAKKEARKSLRHRIMEAYEMEHEMNHKKKLSDHKQYEPDDDTFEERLNDPPHCDIMMNQMGQNAYPENRTLKKTLKWIIAYYKENDELINCNQIKNFADTILIKYFKGYDDWLIDRMTRF